MATPVEMPKSGNTVEECLMTRWVKRTGDRVSAGDVLAEVETDKATFEITAPVAGTLLATFFEEGALVPVFATVCFIGEPGENLEGIGDSGFGIGKQELAISPRARRLAAERNVSLTALRGSGPGGRVVERDVRAASHTAAVQPSRTRDTIARRMRDSLASTAQYTLNASADAAGLLALRARGFSINDLVTFCTVQALVEMPDLNAELIDGRLVQHAEVHIGFACDTPRGLLVPVVRNAHALRIGELSRRMSDLAAQAVAGRISPDDLTGGTFTISNLGGLGIESFTPVINLPQVAILGVGTIAPKPVRTDGRIEFIDAIGLSLTCDHQAIDGAPGARFLQALKRKIEHVEYDVIMRGS